MNREARLRELEERIENSRRMSFADVDEYIKLMDERQINFELKPHEKPKYIAPAPIRRAKRNTKLLFTLWVAVLATLWVLT